MKTVRIVIQTDDVDRQVNGVNVINMLVDGLLTGLKEIGSGNTVYTIEREENEIQS